MQIDDELNSSRQSTTKTLVPASNGIIVRYYRIYEYKKLFIGACNYDLSQQKTQFELLFKFNFVFNYCIITGNYNSNFDLIGTTYCDQESYTINVFNTLNPASGIVLRFIGVAQ